MRAVRYSVGEVAKLSGVTVRTLHHDDDLGLLVPNERSGPGLAEYVRDAVNANADRAAG